MVYTWALHKLKRLPYHDFLAHVCTIMVLGPFGAAFPWGNLEIGGVSSRAGSYQLHDVKGSVRTPQKEPRLMPSRP